MPGEMAKNETEAPQISERLHLGYALIGVVYKHQFNIVDERSTKVNITIENCESIAVLEGKCLELIFEAVGQNATESPDTNVFFPSKLRLRLK